MTRRWNPAEGDQLIGENRTWEVDEVDRESRMVTFIREGRGKLETSISSARRKMLRGNFTLRRSD